MIKPFCRRAGSLSAVCAARGAAGSADGWRRRGWEDEKFTTKTQISQPGKRWAHAKRGRTSSFLKTDSRWCDALCVASTRLPILSTYVGNYLGMEYWLTWEKPVENSWKEDAASKNQRKKKKNLEGDLTNLPSVTFKADRCDFFFTAGKDG